MVVQQCEVLAKGNGETGGCCFTTPSELCGDSESQVSLGAEYEWVQKQVAIFPKRSPL
jgi:hypothetical protein